MDVFAGPLAEATVKQADFSVGIPSAVPNPAAQILRQARKRIRVELRAVAPSVPESPLRVLRKPLHRRRWRESSRAPRSRMRSSFAPRSHARSPLSRALRGSVRSRAYGPWIRCLPPRFRPRSAGFQLRVRCCALRLNVTTVALIRTASEAWGQGFCLAAELPLGVPLPLAAPLGSVCSFIGHCTNR